MYRLQLAKRFAASLANTHKAYQTFLRLPCPALPICLCLSLSLCVSLSPQPVVLVVPAAADATATAKASAAVTAAQQKAKAAADVSWSKGVGANSVGNDCMPVCGGNTRPTPTQRGAAQLLLLPGAGSEC